MTKLTVKDLKILRELDFEARQPIAQIARKVGLSKEAVHYRIKQLEHKGIITGYYPVIDLSKLGYMFCRMGFDLEKANSKIEEDFLNYVRTIPAVGWFIVRSNMNVSIVAYPKTVAEAKEIMDIISNKFYGIVKKKYPSIATKVYHLRRNYLYGTKEEQALVWGEGKPVIIDDIDKKILLFLVRDVQIPCTKIAQSIGLTSVSVINRIKKMEKENLIVGYRCALDLSKLGYMHQKVGLYMENLSLARKKAILQFLLVSPAVVYITEVLDARDLEFEIHVKTMPEFYEFMKRLREHFSEIKSFESTPFHREEIIRYFPE